MSANRLTRLEQVANMIESAYRHRAMKYHAWAAIQALTPAEMPVVVAMVCHSTGSGAELNKFINWLNKCRIEAERVAKASL